MNDDEIKYPEEEPEEDKLMEDEDEILPEEDVDELDIDEELLEE